jgi:hypothetical protein
VPRSSHSPWSDHSNNIMGSVQVTKLLIMQSSPVPRHFLLPLGSINFNFSNSRIKICKFDTEHWMWNWNFVLSVYHLC